MAHEPQDTIDRLAGITAGSAVDRARRGRAAARQGAEEAYRLLLQPENPGDVSLTERHAVALFVAGLHQDARVVTHYRNLLDKSDPTDGALAPAVLQAARSGAINGPYGRYPEGPLTREDKPGPAHEIEPDVAVLLGERLTAGLNHAHLLVLRPREASAAELQKLLDAGWTQTGIVVLSQLVAFLAFQIRAVAGLRALDAAHRAAPVAVPAE
ncbi:CMD domain protein [Pannonibacter tanglangensis]|uniref:CMD domain protein n=1 Tax=Pannonibacter tanglangensis TaxID=2750084 RepID=A0ABW9ZP04_9HYPH|nr:CMD domain protein [Pannonibacter sp. XCT-34]NBN64772.1 CMD domain protein [Pannonibacter sp. XCT-34]